MAHKALSSAEQVDCLELQARAWYELAHINWDRGLYEESLSCDSNGLRIYEVLGDSFNIANTRMGMGVTLYDLKRNDLALDHYLYARDIYKDIGLADRQYFLLLNMALIFNEIKDFDRSGDLLFEALNMAEKSADALGPSHVLHDLGVYYSELDKDAEAIDCYNEALLLYEEFDEPSSMAYVLNNRGNSFTKLKQFDFARQDLLKAQELSVEYADYSMHCFALSNLGNLEVAEGNLAAAELVLDSAMRFAKSMNFIEDQIEIYDHLANLYMARGDYQNAYAQRERFHHLSDSLSVFTSKSAITSALDRYDAKNAAQNAADIERDFDDFVFRNRVALGLGLAFLIVLLTFGIITRRNAQTIRKQNDKLFRINAELEYRSTTANKALKAKEEFLSMMSHELRTPLTSVIGITDLLSMRSRDEEEKQDLELLKFSANNLHLLINNILDFNKLDAGRINLEKVPFDLRDLSTTVWKSHKTTCTNPEIEFVLAINDNLPPTIISDPFRLTQILNNLLGNAVKFTTAGHVTMDIRMADTEGFLQITVSDSGIGIAKEHMSKVFELFSQAEASTTRKFGGTGLGLTIVDRLVKLMNGTITLESEKLKGSTFVVSIPVETVAHLAALRPSTELKPPPKLVLLVDDNELNLRVTRHILMESGVLQVDVATNGPEAIEKCQTQLYDAIVMDIEMPDMDGYDAAEHIRRLNKKVRIIAFSANTVHEVLENDKALNFNAVLSKPASSADLVKVVSQI